MNIYPQLEALSLPFIEAYREDLTKCDKRLIEAFPDVPFLHWTRNYGTYLVHMPDHDHDCYPKEGEIVPYLFGEAGRWHILSEKVSQVRYMLKNEGLRLALFFDGKTIQEISVAKAVEIAENYRTAVERQWRRQIEAKKRAVAFPWEVAA